MQLLKYKDFCSAITNFRGTSENKINIYTTFKYLPTSRDARYY